MCNSLKSTCQDISECAQRKVCITAYRYLKGTRLLSSGVLTFTSSLNPPNISTMFSSLNSFFNLEDWGSTFLRNAGNHLPKNTVSHPRRQCHSWSKLREPKCCIQQYYSNLLYMYFNCKTDSTSQFFWCPVDQILCTVMDVMFQTEYFSLLPATLDWTGSMGW
jgi:hypothetical protein